MIGTPSCSRLSYRLAITLVDITECFFQSFASCPHSPPQAAHLITVWRSEVEAETPERKKYI